MRVSYIDVMVLFDRLRAACPVDTGNLKENGFPFPQFDADNFKIVIGGPNAPYAPDIKLKGTHLSVDNPWAVDVCRAWANEMKQKYGGGFDESET